MKRLICEVHHLGLIPYQDAWELQDRFAAEIAAGDRQPTLLLLEHPHTYTFGRRGDAANLLWDPAELARRGVTVHWVDRGGDVTYHGPGQLVGYPLIPLGSPVSQKVDYVGYLRKLEQMLMRVLEKFGVEGKQVDGLTGVWVMRDSILEISEAIQQSTLSNQQSKILKVAAIGIKVDALGITRHGFALNVDPDMEYWDGILGCGLDHPEISLAQLLDPVPAFNDVIIEVINEFGKTLDFDMILR